MDANLFLLQKGLSWRFTLIMFIENSYGEVQEKSTKLTKKQFLQGIGDEKIHVKVVDSFPEQIDYNVIYMRKDGRTVWCKEVIE